MTYGVEPLPPSGPIVGIAGHWRHSGVAALFALLVPAAAIGDDGPPTDGAPTSAIKPGLVYNGAAFANLGGGARSGGTFTSNFQAQIDVDLAKLVGWEDAIAYVSGLWLQGGQPSSFIGDAQGISSISAPNVVKLYEAWVQKNFAGNHVFLLAGQYDLNSEFYRLQSAGLFLNSSFGIGPEFSQSGAGGPSVFPNTAVGMRVGFKSDDGVVARVAVLDGVPVDRPDGSRGTFEKGDGALIVAEVDLLDRPPSGNRPVPSRLRIGRNAMLGNSQQMQGLPVTRAETTIELTYLVQVNSWLALQPDLRYVISPNTTPTIPNALAFQLRIEASF